MGFLEHLDELRTRIIRSCIAIGAGMLVAFVFVDRLADVVLAPIVGTLPPGSSLVFIRPGEAFSFYLNVAFIGGLLLAAPFVMYQVWRFIAPGLYGNEKKFLIPFVVLTSAGSVGGALFSQYLLFPALMKFYGAFNSPRMRFMPGVEDTVDLYMKMMIGMIVVFQIPTVVFFLAKMRLVTARFLWRHLKYAILIMFIAAAILTPDGSPWNQAVVAVPMIGLYLLSIGLAWIVGPTREKETSNRADSTKLRLVFAATVIDQARRHRGRNVPTYTSPFRHDRQSVQARGRQSDDQAGGIKGLLMKNLWLLATLLGFWAGPAVAQSTDELVNDGKNTENVTTQSMGYDRKSYSPLKQINTSNIKRLVPIWSTSLMNDMGELAAPTIYNGVMYVINGRWTFALDVETGRQIWRTPVEIQPGAQRAAITRGAATIYNGKIFRVTNDNHVLALDMKTGRELWKQKFADSKEGYYATGAPIVANGVLISGMAGGESTTRGFLDGWDPDTGKNLWRRYTIPAPGEPGSETWPRNSDAWMHGGGPTWRSGSYDSQLDLVYWGTGNAEPYDPRPRGALDSLYTSSLLAIRPKSGEVACHFQYTPNDVYDVDGTDENVLADLPVDGQLRKVMIQANKNGFMYVLDRTNCKLIAAHAYVKVNWATHVDLTTGRPVLTDVYKRFLAGEEVEIWPSRGTNAVPIAFDPDTGLIYASTWDVPRVQKIAPPKPEVLGGNSAGITSRIPVVRPGDVLGHFVAINPLTGEKKWEVPLTDFPGSAGMLATGGGLVFTGKLTGEFVALDEATGKTLWQFKTGSSINSTAITYTHNGRQYVTIASGRGGTLASRYTGDKVPTGGSVWTFALMPD